MSERNLLSGVNFQVQRNPTDLVTRPIVISESGRRIKPLACGQKAGFLCPFASQVTLWHLIKGREPYYWPYTSNCNLCDIVILLLWIRYTCLLLFQLCKHNVTNKSIQSFLQEVVFGSTVTELWFGHCLNGITSCFLHCTGAVAMSTAKFHFVCMLFHSVICFFKCKWIS